MPLKVLIPILLLIVLASSLSIDYTQFPLGNTEHQAASIPATNDSSSTSEPNTKGFKLYTALGDSYSAGTFSGPSVPDPVVPRCGRTTSSFAYRFNQDYNPTDFHFNACGGDGSTQCRVAQVQGPQSNFGSPDLVSLTIGGNDLFMFPSIVIACIYGPNEQNTIIVHLFWEVACTVALQVATLTLKIIPRGLEDLVRAAVETNRHNGDQRLVVVLGYAQLWNPERECPKGRNGEDWLGFPSVKQKAKMNSLVVGLNTLLKVAVERVGGGSVFVDMDTAFENHRLCDSEESYLMWEVCSDKANDAVEDSQCTVREGVLHPSWNGHSAYLKALALAASSTQLSRWPKS